MNEIVHAPAPAEVRGEKSNMVVINSWFRRFNGPVLTFPSKPPGGQLTNRSRSPVSNPASMRGDGYTNWGEEFLD